MEHEKSPAHMRRTLLENFILLFLGQGAHAVEAHPKSGQVMEHGGSLPGVSSNLSWSYDAGVGVMVLCNTSGVPVSTIADAAMRMYHGRNPIEDRFVYQETEWDAEKRKAMCGTFRSDEDNNITIFEKDGNLAVKEGETLLRFVPVQEFLGIVRNPDKDGYVRFFENENGEIFAIGYGGRMLPRVKD